MGFIPGGVVALAKQNNDTLTAVGTGDDGRVNVAWVLGTGSWTGPIAVGEPKFDPATATSGALAKQADHVLTFVAVGSQGQMYVTWLDESVGHWQGPAPIGNPVFPTGAPVAMAKQSPTVLTAVAVGADGRLYVSWYQDGSNGWQGPTLIGNPKFKPLTNIALARQNSEIFTALAIGQDRRMNVAWLVEGSGWRAPVSFGPDMYGPGAPVALAMQNDHQLNAVAVNTCDPGQPDTPSHMTVAWVQDGGNWHDPVPFGGEVGPVVFGAPNGYGVALARQSERTLTAMAINNDGRMCVSWETDNGNWNGPIPFGQAVFPPGAHVSMTNWHDDTLAAVAVDRNGHLNIAWVDDGENWNGPFPI